MKILLFLFALTLPAVSISKVEAFSEDELSQDLSFSLGEESQQKQREIASDKKNPSSEGDSKDLPTNEKEDLHPVQLQYWKY